MDFISYSLPVKVGYLVVFTTDELPRVVLDSILGQGQSFCVPTELGSLDL